MPVGPLAAALPPRDHVAQFYSSDEALAQRAGDFLLDALQTGGVAVVVATPPRRAAIEDWLGAAGVDIPFALDAGTVLCFDASETLGRMVVDGRLDRGLFWDVIGEAVQPSSNVGLPVHVYGEMVDLLWQSGQVSSALELEALWNELQQAQSFSLFCSYRSELLSDEDCADLFEEVCWSHSAIVTGPTDRVQRGRAGLTEASRAFPADPRSPLAARRFVIESLQDWAADQLLGDAGLVATELATNAVKHARTAFRVTVVPIDDRVRVSVRDAGMDRWMPSVRALNAGPAPALDAARGLGLIAAVAAKWGMRPLDNGKVVWADLARPEWRLQRSP
ncbi:MAG TPA: MEDS domain-containing protein [Acidimicrobiales bacterium]|nr:MEDS domain-containing protein [Acidimicrobiales bacterium]